jgi:hypothetical protein
MIDEVIERRGTTLVRRLRLERGEAQRWHRDPYHRVSVVLSGDLLRVEYRDGGPSDRVELRAGLVGWDEPNERVHRGVNAGTLPYEEITVFLLDAPDADPQPGDGAPEA